MTQVHDLDDAVRYIEEQFEEKDAKIIQLQVEIDDLQAQIYDLEAEFVQAPGIR